MMRDVAGQQASAVIDAKIGFPPCWQDLTVFWSNDERANIRRQVHARIAEGQLTGEAVIGGRRVRWSVPAEEGKA